MPRTTLLSMCIAVVFAAGCFDAPKPACAFLCGDDGACPDGYTCRPDSWCKRGDAADVPDNFTCDDTTPPPPIDADTTIDSSTASDAAIVDAGFALGTACTSGDQCNSGFCSDDVCCEEACTGDCNACSTAAGSSANGTCDFLTTECRASTGECDPAETCTGSSATCPTDSFATPGTQCTDSSPTNCDDAQCNAAGTCVQTGAVELASYECRASTGECDPAETCNGTDGGACPTDLFTSSGTQCTDTDTLDCLDAQCNGTGACVQDFANEVLDTPCGDGSDTECTDPDTCGDDDGICAPNNVTDGLTCTGGGGEDTCCSGICVVGPCP